MFHQYVGTCAIFFSIAVHTFTKWGWLGLAEIGALFYPGKKKQTKVTQQAELKILKSKVHCLFFFCDFLRICSHGMKITIKLSFFPTIKEANLSSGIISTCWHIKVSGFVYLGNHIWIHISKPWFWMNIFPHMNSRNKDIRSWNLVQKSTAGPGAPTVVEGCGSEGTVTYFQHFA